MGRPCYPPTGAAMRPRPMKAMDAKPPAWLHCPDARDRWNRVVDAICLEAVSTSATPRTCTPLLQKPGKCVRAGLLLTSAEFGVEPDADRLVSLAMAVELVHLASLLHDDVVDDAPLRRGLWSASRVWGDAAAAYSGGYLLSRAMGLFAAAGSGPNSLASATVLRMWNGEMEEVENLGNGKLPLRRCLAILNNKTGALFELSCVLGVRCGHSTGIVSSHLGRFGRRFGTAFQLADDLADLLHTDAVGGKVPGVDLRRGICTLPILHCIRQGTSESRVLREIVAGEPAEADVEQVRYLLGKTGSFEYAADFARRYLVSATAALSELVPGAAVASLRAVAQSLGERLDGFA